MGRLTLTLLGGFQARLGSGAVVRFRTRHTQALLAYLALPCGRSQPRDKLAALLWGHLAQDEARNRLRQALFALRRALSHAHLSCLRVDGDALVLDPAGVEVDALAFEELVREGSLDALERAAIVYQGDLLQGLPAQGPHPSAFEEWLGGERERLRELALEALAKLVNVQRAAESPERALSTALRLLALDPVQEAAHRIAMRLHAQLGRRTAALRHYQACVNTLRRELNVEPEEETRQLYRDILRRRPILAASRPGSRTAVWPAAASPSEDNAPLIGRELETDRLRAWLAQAASGECQVALLVGETGAGKSRLVAKLVSEALAADAELRPRPLRILLGRCHEGEQILPFGPWIDAFRVGRLLEDGALIDKLDPIWRAELTRLLPELGGTKVNVSSEPPDAPRLFEGVRQLVACLVNRSPVVLILEDLHWADEMSLRMLQFIAHRASGWPLLLVGTVREEELPDLPLLRQTLETLESQPHVERVRVPSLSRRATLQLVRALSSTTSESATLERIGEEVWRASEGNPFVVVETMRALQQGISLVRSGGLPIVERVRRMIARRLDRLSEVARDLAAVGAVIGRRFEFSLLQRAASRDEAATADGVEELVRRQILHGVAGGFDFVHERVRGVVYAELLAPRRCLLHRRVAEAIEAQYPQDLDRHLVALGLHCCEGELWDKAVGYLRRAGLNAAERSAHREAATSFEKALVALRHLPELPDTIQQVVDIRLELRSSLNPLGDMTRLHEHLREAEALATKVGDHRRLGQIAAFMTQTFAVMGDHGAAARSGQRALEIATALGDLRLRVFANYFLHQSCYFSGDYRRAIDGLQWNIAALEGELQHERFGSSTYPSIVSRAGLAACLAELGEFAEGAAHGERAVRMAEALDHPYSLIQASWAVSTVYLRRGDVQNALPLLERAARVCRLRDIPRQLFPSTVFLGFAYALARRIEEAVLQLEQAEALREAWGATATWTHWLAEGFWLVGRFEDAARIGGRALTQARENSERGNQAWLLRLFGGLDSQSDPPALIKAESHYQQALALATELGMRPLVAHCHLGLGKLSFRTEKCEQAQQHLTTATTMYRDLGMAHWLEKAEIEVKGLA
jgi:DNA-binding SARP family transcriptional activator